MFVQRTKVPRICNQRANLSKSLSAFVRNSPTEMISTLWKITNFSNFLETSRGYGVDCWPRVFKLRRAPKSLKSSQFSTHKSFSPRITKFLQSYRSSSSPPNIEVLHSFGFQILRFRVFSGFCLPNLRIPRQTNVTLPQLTGGRLEIWQVAVNHLKNTRSLGRGNLPLSVRRERELTFDLRDEDRLKGDVRRLFNFYLRVRSPFAPSIPGKVHRAHSA